MVNSNDEKGRPDVQQDGEGRVEAHLGSPLLRLFCSSVNFFIPNSYFKVFGPISVILAVLAFILFLVFRKEIWNPILNIYVLFALICAILIAIYLFGFVIYGSIVTLRYIKDSEKLNGGQRLLSRIRYTQRLMVAFAVLFLVNGALSAFNVVQEYPVYSFYGNCLTIILGNVIDMIILSIIHGRIVFTKSDGSNSMSSMESTSSTRSKKFKNETTSDSITNPTNEAQNSKSKDTSDGKAVAEEMSNMKTEDSSSS